MRGRGLLARNLNLFSDVREKGLGADRGAPSRSTSGRIESCVRWLWVFWDAGSLSFARSSDLNVPLKVLRGHCSECVATAGTSDTRRVPGVV